MSAAVISFTFLITCITSFFKCTNYLIFSDEISLIKSQAEVMSYEGIQDILNSIDKVKVRLKANVNFDLCIELLIMAMKEDM